MTTDTLPPESPVAVAVAAAERVLFHERAKAAAADELVHALAEASHSLERDVANWRERQRPALRWVEALVRRLSEVAP